MKTKKQKRAELRLKLKEQIATREQYIADHPYMYPPLDVGRGRVAQDNVLHSLKIELSNVERAMLREGELFDAAVVVVDSSIPNKTLNLNAIAPYPEYRWCKHCGSIIVKRGGMWVDLDDSIVFPQYCTSATPSDQMHEPKEKPYETA